MLGNFSCGRYRFVLRAESRLRLNAFAGSTLRGGFGHVFKRTVCAWPPGDCPRCMLKTTCSYPYIFETAPPPGATKLRLIDQIPRPFIIEPPSADFSPSGLDPMNRVTTRKRSAGNHGSAAVSGRASAADNRKLYGPGERFDFNLVFVGRAIDYLPYFLFTFIELSRVGLGRGLTAQTTPVAAFGRTRSHRASSRVSSRSQALPAERGNPGAPGVVGPGQGVLIQKGKLSMANTSNGANLGFETDLWRAADALRSNMDADEYRAGNANFAWVQHDQRSVRDSASTRWSTQRTETQ